MDVSGSGAAAAADSGGSPETPRPKKTKSTSSLASSKVGLQMRAKVKAAEESEGEASWWEELLITVEDLVVEGKQHNWLMSWLVNAVERLADGLEREGAAFF